MGSSQLTLKSDRRGSQRGGSGVRNRPRGSLCCPGNPSRGSRSAALQTACTAQSALCLPLGTCCGRPASCQASAPRGSNASSTLVLTHDGPLADRHNPETCGRSLCGACVHMYWQPNAARCRGASVAQTGRLSRLDTCACKDSISWQACDDDVISWPGRMDRQRLGRHRRAC